MGGKGCLGGVGHPWRVTPLCAEGMPLGGMCPRVPSWGWGLRWVSLLLCDCGAAPSGPQRPPDEDSPQSSEDTVGWGGWYGRCPFTELLEWGDHPKTAPLPATCRSARCPPPCPVPTALTRVCSYCSARCSALSAEAMALPVLPVLLAVPVPVPAAAAAPPGAVWGGPGALPGGGPGRAPPPPLRRRHPAPAPGSRARTEGMRGGGRSEPSGRDGPGETCFHPRAPDGGWQQPCRRVWGLSREHRARPSCRVRVREGSALCLDAASKEPGEPGMRTRCGHPSTVRTHRRCLKNALTAALPAPGWDPRPRSSLPGGSGSAFSAGTQEHSLAPVLLGRRAAPWHSGCSPSGAAGISISPPQRAQEQLGQSEGPSSLSPRWHSMARSAKTELWHCRAGGVGPGPGWFALPRCRLPL